LNFSEEKLLVNLCSSKDKGARKRGSKKDALTDEEKRRLSTMCEEEEDEPGITIKVDHAL